MSSVATSILTLKDAEITYRPTVLYTVTFTNSTSVRFSKADNGNQRGVTWNGNFYSAVVMGQAPFEQGGQSSTGLDIVGSISVTLADADCSWWYYEQQVGFQGASIQVDYVFFDPLTGGFSTDSKRIFQGICDPATRNGKAQTITINAKARNALDKVFLPLYRIQRTCSWDFPATAAQRYDAANTPLSRFYRCGYSADQTGGNARGNLQGGAPYTSCPKDVLSCQNRGMWSTDNAARATARFGGVGWDPPATFKGTQYISGKQVQGINNANPSKWSAYRPTHFGTCWVPGIPANNVGDPNSTRGEVILSDRWVNSYANDWIGTGIQQVVVNGILIPYASQTKDLLLRWYDLTDGSRNGKFTQGPIFEGKGDPYGSTATILPIVYSQIASSNTNWSVMALMGPPPVPVYTATNFWDWARSSNMAWVLLEVLRLCLPNIHSQIDIQSVMTYATKCAVSVSYTNLYNQTATHQRFKCALLLTQKQTGQQIVDGLKIAGRVLIVPNAQGTALRMVCKETLCEQQPNPVPGSNRNTPIASFRATDNPTGSPTGTGYSAYHFDESNCLAGSISFLQDPIASTPVSVTAEIVDEDNDYIEGRVTVADPIAADRIQQTVEATLPVLGFPNFDQAYRGLQVYQAERFRGNPRHDSGGTLRIQLSTTFRALHLAQGDLVTFSNAQMLIGFQTFRIENISADEYKQMTFLLRWHEDAWYTDGYGQTPDPYTVTYLGQFAGQRPPFPWQPNGATAVAADAWHPGGSNVFTTFDLQIGDDLLADGTALPEILISGKMPVNKPANALAPRLARQGFTSLTGGGIPNATTCFTYVTAVDGAGNESVPNLLPSVSYAPGAANQSSIQVPVLQWPAGTAGYRVYNGPNPLQAGLVASGSGTPSTLLATALSTSNASPPDPAFDHFVVRQKRLVSAGYLLFGPGPSQTVASINTVTSSTIDFGYCVNLATNNQYIPGNNELAGRILIACYQQGGGDIPYLQLKIASNANYTVSINMSGGTTDLTTLALQNMWFLVAHQVSVASGSYVTFVSSSLGFDTTGLVGSLVRVIAGTGAGQDVRTITLGYTGGSAISVDQAFDPPLSTDSILVIEEPSWRKEWNEPRVANSLANAPVQIRSSFDNTNGQFGLIQVATADAGGQQAPEWMHPVRLWYWPGTPPGETFYQALNILPNANLQLAGAPGEVASGYSIIKNTQNAYQVTLDPINVYSGRNALLWRLPGTGSGWTLQPGVPFDCAITTTHSIALPQRNARHFMQAWVRCDSTLASLPAGVEIVVEYRINIGYSDGSFDVSSALAGAGWFGSQTNPVATWIQISQLFTTRADLQCTDLHLAFTVYINSSTNPSPVQVYPTGHYFDVHISGISLTHTIDLGKQVFGDSLSGIVGQGSIIPSQIVPITVALNANDGAGGCHINLAWPTTNIVLSDQSTVTVPAGNMDWQGISVATYYFYFRVSASLSKTGLAIGTMNLASGNAPTTPPTAPNQAFANAQNFDGWYPLPLMTVTTPSNTGTGGGSGGGPDACPEFQERVYVQDRGVVRIGNVEVGEWIRGKDWDTGLDVYHRVKSKRIEPSSVWRIVAGRRVSPMHSVSFPDRLQWQQPWRIGTLDTTLGLRVSLTLDIPHDRYDHANFALVDEEGQTVLIMHNNYISPS